MRDFSAAPFEMIASLWRNRGLVHASAKREVLGRYRGSVLGLMWSLFNPLLMLAVYSFVFGVVFNSRWGGGSSSKVEFALVLFAGLIIFNLFADCISRAPNLIVSNPNYVSKVVFPLEILPFVSFLSALYHAVVSLGVWLIAYIVLFGVPKITVFVLPIIVLPFALFIMGLSWVLASLGVFLRDVSQFIGIAVNTLMFLSPIFYPITALPEGYRQILYLNPITPAVEATRGVLYWGVMPDFLTLTIYWLVSGLIAWLGFAWFQKTRKGFADVL
jgi:lipopolysaccharide transport system permease protein